MLRPERKRRQTRPLHRQKLLREPRLELRDVHLKVGERVAEHRVLGKLAVVLHVPVVVHHAGDEAGARLP